MLFNSWARFSYFLKDFSLYLVLLFTAIAIFPILAYKVKNTGDMSKRKKKILISLIATLFSVIFVFSLFEAYFRYVYDQSDGLGFMKVNRKWHERHVIFNNYFRRDRNFEPVKEKGVIRIGVIGDSITLGGGIEKVEDRFSNILETKLRNANYNVEVYNLGVSGIDTKDEIGEYQKLKHLNFDVIIWQYFLNDIQPSSGNTAAPILIKNSQRAKIVKSFSDTSYFFDFLYWRFSSKYQKTILELKTSDLDKYRDTEILSNHKKEISEFIAELRSENKKVLVIIFPYLYILGPNYPGDIHEILSSHFTENGVEVIDLLQEFINTERKKLMASRFDAHPNEIVHALAAQKLFEVIEPLLKQ